MYIVYLLEVFARVQQREHDRGNSYKSFIKNEKKKILCPNIILNPLKQKIKTQITIIKISLNNNKNIPTATNEQNIQQKSLSKTKQQNS